MRTLRILRYAMHLATITRPYLRNYAWVGGPAIIVHLSYRGGLINSISLHHIDVCKTG
jgi:hypothetical protein